jgi:xylulokinase
MGDGMAVKDGLLLGLDIGTSGCKALLIDAMGREVALERETYDVETPQQGWAEQDPRVWLDAVALTVQRALARGDVDPESVVGIGLTGQMHSTVLLDGRDEPLRPAVLWLDRRSAPEVTTFRSRIGKEQLADWTGNPLVPGFTLASLLWLRDHAPTMWHHIAQVLLPKDYVRLWLTGERGTECTDASATGLFDVEARRWCEPLLQKAQIPLKWLPDVRPSREIAGSLRSSAAKALGLPTGVPVVYGAGDQEAQAVGNGILDPGVVSATIGTGGQLFAPLDHYQHDPALRVHTFCHVTSKRWHWEAAILTAGAALGWLRDQVLGGAHDYAALADAAAEVPPGADDLIFLPYLVGERTPHMDPDARGAFYGLTLQHDWRYMARAVMEGVVFALKDGLACFVDLGAVVRCVIAAGGATRHPLWLQLQADIFNTEITRSATREATALGAALLAGVGVGLYPDLSSACEQVVKWQVKTVEPRPRVAIRYQEHYAAYRALYPVLEAP